MMMHNHGLLSCGRTAAEAFWYMYYMEMSCKIQVDVLTSGTEYMIPRRTRPSRGLREYGRPKEEPRGAREWPGLLRMLDRIDPGFRN